ncbi:MAG: two-component system, OmpR family, sensor histidine kinase CpxA [Acidobacteriota bacterium]|nr:two-component system, OmpR family, sensor histidine kinase CpxA [Acidobacteriota bacterium]
MVLVVGAILLITHLTHGESPPRPPQFVESVVAAYARNAVETYERDGASSLDSFLHHVENESNVRARLFDLSAKSLAGGDVTVDEQELAGRVAQTRSPASKMADGMAVEARPAPAREGDKVYVFVASFPLRPPPPPRGLPEGQRPPRPPFGHLGFLIGDTPTALGARLAAAILIAGLLCYWLARYITSPVLKLRGVTRRVSEGDLSARVSPLLGGRRDELGALGRDFDEMAARVETLVTAQNRLVRDISHELRSPLARLNVALDLARKRAGSDAASALERIEREAVRLNEMISQLLTLARRESGNDATPRESVDLAKLLREIVADADFEARAHDRTVQLTSAEECYAQGTTRLLHSAVENVVRNALRHTPEGSAVEVSLEYRNENGQGLAVIAVRDRGAGVPEAVLADIFRPFYRVDDARDRESGGTGLGLAITQRAVQTHGGTVTASNLAGSGFAVEIRLPATRTDAHATVATSH